MTYTYKPRGVCSRQIDFEIENDIITAVKFTGGCSGNTQGVARLCIGRSPEEVISILDGIRCGPRKTSCPDQFAQALKQAIGR